VKRHFPQTLDELTQALLNCAKTIREHEEMKHSASTILKEFERLQLLSHTLINIYETHRGD
jgi:hypothetical protein